MSNVRYLTTRELRNDQGKITGMIKVLVPKDSNNAKVKYVCPMCLKEAETAEEWKKPFAVNCKFCGYKIKLPKLMAQFKKEKKTELAGSTKE
ncbi:MAG: hypothetical protein HY516_02665 [Candidatus Aenigmarchaeota archaeon]|nr:hypothetical protein [Candidatus Aenigmarchaeota archaeon]